MSSTSWRKKIVHSSIQQASRRLASEGNETAIFAALSSALLALLSSAAQAGDAHSGTTIPFDIPQQRADLSLIEFARQANITLIFPFDDAMEVTANSLVGRYSIEEAVRLLLANTRLKVSVGEDGQLMVTSHH